MRDYRRSLCALILLRLAEFARIRVSVTADTAGRPKSGDFGYKRSQPLLALILLAILAGCGRGVDPSVVDPHDVLRERLGRIATLDWDDLPLTTAPGEGGG